MPFRAYAPQAFVLAISVIALVWAPLAYALGWVTYATNNIPLAFAASAVWALWNIYFAAHVVRMSLRMKQQRADHRFLENLAVRMRVLAEGGAPAVEQLTSLQNLNPLGLAFRSTTAFSADTRLAFTLPLSNRIVLAEGSVVHVETVNTAHGPVHNHGVRFEGMPVEDRDAIELHCTQYSVPMWRKRYRQSLDVFARTNELMHNARTKRRHSIQLPVHVWMSDETLAAMHTAGLLEELSASGARLLLDDPIPPGSPVRFEVPGSTLSGEGTVVFAHALESTASIRFSVGLSLKAANGVPRRRWGGTLLSGSSEGPAAQPAILSDTVVEQ